MMLLDYRIGTVVKLTLNGVGVLCGMRNIGNVCGISCGKNVQN